MKNFSSAFLLATTMAMAVSGIGCVGWNVWQPIQGKPYTYFSRGDQFGRDQVANRTLAAYATKLILKGKDSRDVLTLLGQPQEIEIVERHVSEDWYFLYYKTYVAYNPANKIPYPGKDSQGEFVVRIENDKVVDVVRLS